MRAQRITSSILLICISFSGWSQITSSFFPVLPDTIMMATQSSNIQYYPGPDGVGQSWNFSQFLGNEIDSIFFKDPVAAGYGTVFPAANVFKSETADPGSFALPTFYDVQGSGAYEVGQIIPTPGDPINVPYSEPLLWLPFPSNLGTAFSDTAFLSAIIEGSLVNIPADSVRFERTIFRRDTIAASGSLLLSSGYYPNVFRKTTTDIWYDTIYTYNTGVGWELAQTDEREVIKHSWIDPSQPFNLAELYIEEGLNRGFRARPFNPGPLSYYLDITGNVALLNEGDIHPNFTVSVRNISNNLIASGYSTDSIRVTGGGNVNGSLAEWCSAGVATFDSVFFHSGGDIRIIAYGFECISDTFDVHVIKTPDSLAFVSLPATVNRTEMVGTFEVHAFDTNNEQAQLNIEWAGDINIGKKSGAGGISGTLSQPLINGIATFDDISFNYADDYEIVAYFINVDSPDTSSITVMPEPEGEWLFNRIDTLSEYLERATWFAFLGGYQGASSGPSRVPIWTEIGQHFDFEGSGRVTEVMIHVSSLQNVGAEEDSIRVNIYDAGVNRIIRTDLNPLAPLDVSYVDSLAKHLLGSTYIREDSLLTMFPSQFGIFTPLKWPLAEPIDVHGPFVMTVQLNYNNGVNDTLIVWHSEIGDGIGEHRASRKVINNENGFANGEWLPEYMAQAFTQIDYDFMFEPIVEVDSFQVVPVGVPTEFVRENLIIYPSVTDENIRITGFEFEPVTISVKDVLGKTVFSGLVSGKASNSTIWLSVGHLNSGMYIVELLSEDNRKQAVGRFTRR